MEAESVKSGYSDHSQRSRRSHGGGGIGGIGSSSIGIGILGNNMGSAGHNHIHGHRTRTNRHPNRTSRGDRTIISSTPKGDADGENRDGEEVIEVQILPQDDNWGDNTTAITGNTSEHSFSVDDITKMGKDFEQGFGFKCTQYVGSVLAGILATFAFISPIIMIILPKFELFNWPQEECGPKCDGLLISFAFKLLILLIGTWAVFLRKPKASMPRIFVFRAIILALVFVFTFSYWLFYGVRILERHEKDYHSIVLFSVSLVDALLFIHYLAVILLEVRQFQPQFTITVVRSPDGESRCYNLGQLSIQRAAVWVLEQYYRDFPIYNPYLDRVPTSRTRKTLSNFKIYDVDGVTPTAVQGQSRAMMAAAAGRRDTSHNERFYEEQEYQRRVKKRRARLITAAEEAFTHIKRLQEEQGPAIPMDPGEAAQAVFPSMARALQKYLRITRQQPRYTMESILEHLAICISHDMSPRAFLEKYFNTTGFLHNDRDYRSVQTWALICDILLSHGIEDGTLFQLRQNEISLLVSVRSIPYFNITEEVIDPENNKFVLRLNSETSV